MKPKDSSGAVALGKQGPQSERQQVSCHEGQRAMKTRRGGRNGMTKAPKVELRQVAADIFGNPIRLIEFAADGTSRVRQIVTRSRARATGKYPSWKMKRMLQWESERELDVFRVLDADPAVVAFREQPARISYVVDGEVHFYYPDILVEFGGRKEFWEIKAHGERLDKGVKARSALMEEALPAWGYGYRLVLAKDYACEPALGNAETLLRFGRGNVPPRERERIRQYCKAAGGITWGAALAGTFGPTGRGQVSRLVLEGALTFDRSRPLTAETLLVLAYEQALMRGAA